MFEHNWVSLGMDTSGGGFVLFPSLFFKGR